MAVPKSNRRPRIQLPERKTPPPPAPQSPIKAIKGFEESLEKCRQMTEKYSGQYRCITDPEELRAYLDVIIKNGRAAIDTETTGLNVFKDQVVGFSLYTAGEKACYVPLRHLSRFTGKIDTAQMPVDVCAKIMNSLPDTVRLDYANAQFDLLMKLNSLGIDYSRHPLNDALLMGRIQNTERKKGNRGLKELHAEFCSGTRGPKFSDLFPKGSFNLCPFHLGYTYAARDAEMTWELVDALTDVLKAEPALWNVYTKIEVPLIPVLIRMRLRGVLVDQARRAELTAKYTALQKEAQDKIETMYAPFIPKIRAYQQSPAARQPKCGIDLPVKIGSNDQIKVLFNQIMGIPLEGADKGALINTHTPIGDALLEWRACQKLLSTYLVGLEKFLHADDTVHGGINQIGADTGRTSAVDPNMQNIPSRNREIRTIYRARPGYALVSCDYSGQEPRLTASLCKDETMIKTYQEGKDLYSMIAAVAFNTTYEECQEHLPNGELYKEGKWRRGQAKTIVLGICYGRQIPSIADQLGCTKEEAQAIYDKVTGAFPGLLRAQDEAAEQAHEFGYVSTLWGRRRHLSPMKHNDYKFEYAPGCNPDFDPFNPDADALSTEVPKPLAKKYESEIKNICWFKDREQYIGNLRSNLGIITHDYSRARSDMSRKCLNARIQGSAADMSKLAMIAIDKDERLKALDSHLVLMIHDEVICEVPKANLHEAVPIIQELMQNVAKELPVPFKSDAEVSDVWYGKEINYDEEEDDI